MNEEDMKEVERLKALMLKRSYFVMFRTIVDPSRLAPVMLEHYRWIIALEKQDKVFASGPMFGKAGEPGVGMTVFRTESYEDAEAMAAGDPFIASGAATFEIKRWQINEGRLNISVDFSDQGYQFN